MAAPVSPQLAILILILFLILMASFALHTFATFSIRDLLFLLFFRIFVNQNAKWEECATEMERILFLIKNMNKMDSTSLAYREGNFTEIFEAARSSQLKKDEVIAYSQSLEKLRDTQRGIQYALASAEARVVARAEGLAEGRAEGRAERRAEEKIEIARKMMESGVAKDQIALFTGLSISDILNL